MKALLFSIVILAWNVEEFITECLESVKNQTYSNFEAIIVVPECGDDTLKICKSFAEYDKRFKVVKTENRGQNLNRMAGFLQANGDYVICLDGDDIWKQELLQTINEGLCDNSCDLVIFGHERFEAEKITTTVQHVFPDCMFFNSYNKAEVYLKYIKGGPINEIWAKAWKRELLVKLEELFTEYGDIRRSEDLLFSCFITNVAENVLYIDKVLYRYRIRKGSVIHSFNESEIVDYYCVKERIDKFIQEWNLNNPVVYSDFNNAITAYTADWIYRCSISDIPFSEKLKLYKWLRNECPYINEIETRIKTVTLKKRVQVFAWLYFKNFYLLGIYSFMYRVLKVIKSRIIH